MIMWERGDDKLLAEIPKMYKQMPDFVYTTVTTLQPFSSILVQFQLTQSQVHQLLEMEWKVCCVSVVMSWPCTVGGGLV